MYITNYNLKRLIRQISSAELETNKTEFLKDIHFLTKSEEKELLLIRLVSEKPELLSDDSFQFVRDEHEFLNGKQPAYHQDENCDRLNSPFVGMSIPQTLINSGRTIEVKEWLKENEYLLEGDKEHVFEMRFQLRFGCKIGKVIRDNSGSVVFYNDSIKNLEQMIIDLLERAQNFGETIVEKKIINAFAKIHYITKREDFVSTHYTTEQVKTVMKEFNKQVRYPLIELLRKFFIMKYNSKLEYSQSVLDQLGFVPCRCCKQNN